MQPLTRKQDPTGVFNYIRHVASDRFGDPNGIIQGRGRIEHTTKKGPGRRRPHHDCEVAGTKLSRKAGRLGHGRGL